MIMYKKNALPSQVVRLCFGVKLFVVILWGNFLCFLVVSYWCQPEW